MAGTLIEKTVANADGLTFSKQVITADANGNVIASGRAAASASRPAVLSNEDFAELKRASAGATVSVASAVTVVTLKAANANRYGLIISNDSTSILYVLLGAGIVSAALYTYALPPKATVAASIAISSYTGVVTGVWATANGAALVTELT